MTLRNRAKNLGGLFRAGLLIFVIANLARWLASSKPLVSESLLHGGVGVLYGLSIVLMIAGFPRRGSTSRGGICRLMDDSR